MSDTVISVDHLSKLYRIGMAEKRHESLFSAMAASLAAPVRNFRKLNRLDTLKHNGKSDDSLWALRDVSFEVKRGEVLGIIGRNGAGKSTLLKILSRVTEPTAGRIRMRGRVSSLLEVGTGFHPELTGRENVYLNGTILGMTKREIDRKFDEIVAFSGVEKFLDTPVKRYSSGMKVRLAFSVAAHLEPDILIVDEVLAVGDADFQRKCIGKMRDVAGSGGRTILLVSHNMASIASLAGQSVYLRDGQAVACGPTEEVIDLYMQQVHRPVGDGKPGLFVPRPETGSKSLVKSLEVYSRGRRTDTMRMGDDLKFLVTLDGQARPDVLSGVVGIAIDTTTGVRVLSLGSGQSGFRFENNGGDIRVTCDTGSCPLNQGQYLIRLVLAVKPGMPLENREALGHLHVLPSDVFGDGQLLTEHQGFIFWKADWNQQATDSDFASVDHGVSNIVGEDSL